MGTADLDPSGLTDDHTSAGMQDSYIIILNSSLVVSNTLVYSSTDSVLLYDLVSDGTYAYAGGSFGQTVDFNPLGTPDQRTSSGVQDCFLVKFDSTGAAQWINTWGGAGEDFVITLSAGSPGEIFTGGSFSETVDLDPSGGIDEHNSNGLGDVYISKFLDDGSYQWANSFGSTDWLDQVYGITAAFNNIYAAGAFQGEVNFDPSGGTPEPSAGGYNCFLQKYEEDGTW
jgi:hypothetical protein